ncbi:tyrosine-type recombinase/integrase [Escherichia coli]|uniref:tyrosine-type recombinase/integrase n=1 Tax=Escherichia coli TaxID=562 RepID=UPI000BE4C4DB
MQYSNVTFGDADSPWFFPSRNGTHIIRQRFWQIIRAYAVMAGLAVSVHPHMLRHACGFALAERGNDVNATMFDRYLPFSFPLNTFVTDAVRFSPFHHH